MLVKLPTSYRVALYIQEDKHGEEQADSLLSQLKTLMIKVKRWGTIAEIYVDTSSPSAFNRDRPGLSMLLADVHRGKFDAILVTEIWRLFRNAEVGYELSELITSAGKYLISLDGLVDTMNENSTLLDHYKWVHFQRLMDKSK
ncbi:recombinase family protein [Paenibacillus tyrfis]|uniref:recombinase family protein n=1 Tax=Paenibacillus tyrfis TaxID=1501230 RepID=UPI0015C5DE7A|nr:recombinase family protein [Paenibacillus tyrfis]